MKGDVRKYPSHGTDGLIRQVAPVCVIVQFRVKMVLRVLLHIHLYSNLVCTTIDTLYYAPIA